MLKKINKFIHKISKPLNATCVIIGLVVSIAHVYIPFMTPFGLASGIFMAISGSIMYALNLHFSEKFSRSSTDDNLPPRKHTLKSSLFLAFIIPALILSTISNFFGMYTGILLLAPAIAFPIALPAVIATAIILGSIFAATSLLNAWLMSHAIWEQLKKEPASRGKYVDWSQYSHLEILFNQKKNPKQNTLAAKNDKPKEQIIAEMQATKLSSSPFCLQIPKKFNKDVNSVSTIAANRLRSWSIS